MKGKLLSINETKELKDGTRVWLEKTEGLDCEYNQESKVYQIKNGTFYHKDDSDYIQIYVDGSAVKHGWVEVYEWIESAPVTYDLQKTYKGSEILAMIENEELTDEDVIVDGDGDWWKIEDIKSHKENYKVACSVLLNYAPFTIKENPVDIITAAKAFVQGENVRCEYPSASDKTEIIKKRFRQGEDLGVTRVEDTITLYMIAEGEWYIEN